MTAEDAAHMSEALALAERGIYSTTPNPSVGCVLVQAGRVIGRGFTSPAGGLHAEANALADARAAREAVAGATAYVTLEPCSHFGRTPPCADALIEARVVRVVAAMIDPDARVAAQGIARLRAAGVAVEVGLCEAQARALLAGYIKRQVHGRPLVRIKLAMSLDGRTAMASGESQWITGALARRDVQRWRARSCAIITGAGTVLSDDPLLNVRELNVRELNVRELNVRELTGVAPPYRQPLRVVLDRRARVPMTAQIMRTAVEIGPVMWVAAGARLRDLAQGVEWLDANLRVATLPGLLDELGRRGCNEVLIEAGASLAGAFVEQRLMDELIVYVAPKLLGDRGRPLLALNIERMREARDLQLIDQQRFGDDLRLHFRQTLTQP